jgi:adenine phosphoribosyltransferase
MTVDLKDFIRDIPDFPVKGIIFKDITPLLMSPVAFKEAIEQLAAPFLAGELVDKIAGVEARGFIFGAALAMRLGIGFVPIRKKGKLPADTVSLTYDLEYGTDTIEIHKDAIEPGEKVLLIDDLLATGGTLAASADLLESIQADIVEIATVIDLTFLNGKAKLEGRPFRTLIEY